MTQNRNLDYGQRLPESLLDSLQELLGSYASPNFRLTLANPTTLQLVAGVGDDQVCVAVDGRWRWITNTINAAHPGGAAGTYAVYVTASDNIFVPGTPETDNTVYTFALEIRTSGVPSTALSRKAADLAWDGSAITSIIPAIPATLAVGSITTAAILDGTILIGDLSQGVWVAVNGVGVLAARPPAAAGNAGYLYFATDVDGGSVYRSDGVGWTRFAAVNPPPNSVLTGMLVDGSVTLAKLAAGSVDGSKIVDGSVALADLASGAVDTSKLVDGSVTLAKLAANSVDGSKLVDGSVTLADLAPNSVDASKIIDGNVGLAKLAAAAVDATKVAPSLKPSGGAAAGTEALRALGTAAGTAAAGDDARFNALPAFVTSLPASPADDQEAILVDSLANPSYAWHMRYKTAPAKWIFIGGSWLSQFVAAPTISAPASFTAIPGAPALAIPRAGLYDVQLAGDLRVYRAGCGLYIGPGGAGITPTSVNALVNLQDGASDNSSANALPVVSVSESKRQRLNLAVGTLTLWAQFNQNGGANAGYSFSSLSIAVCPVTLP